MCGMFRNAMIIVKHSKACLEMLNANKVSRMISNMSAWSQMALSIHRFTESQLGETERKPKSGIENSLK